jgi:prepilin peptidase CpaA
MSAFFDFRFRRIPNWLIAVGMASGLVLNAFASLTQLFHSFAGLVLGILLLLLPFALGWIGAGDVKFFGVVGSLLGIGWLPRVFFYSSLLAGAIAIFSLILGKSQFGQLQELWADMKLLALSHGHVAPNPVHRRTKGGRGSVPWGVAFAAGTIIAYYFDAQGRIAGF